MEPFDAVIEGFKKQELLVDDWNFVVHKEDSSYAAYIMGDGVEQCLTFRCGFASQEEVIDFFKSLGVKHVLKGLG